MGELWVLILSILDTIDLVMIEPYCIKIWFTDVTIKAGKQNQSLVEDMIK